jgi:translocation and assembly module TamA
LGYNASAQFIKPEFKARDQSLQIDTGALRQKLEAYDQDAVTAAISLNRKFSDIWRGSAGVSAIRERILQEGVTRDYTLLGIPLNAKYDSTGVSNALEDPLHGIRASATVTPTQSFGPAGATFVIVQGSASGYFDLASVAHAEPGRTVFAWRALIGSAQGASQFQLPPDQRFYGGGSATVRGFRYQSIGPQFPDGKPIGGTSIDAATIELRQRLPNNLGAVAFVDAGQVGADSTPFQGTARIGAGIGIRYYTAIGPIRLDVAVPLNRQRGDDAFELYIGLGQAF